jgi:hypothetical protein
MGSVRHPRGRLPRRVYWTRRGLVLGLALLLVFGIGKLLGGTGQDPASSDIKASTSSSTQAPQATGNVGPVAPATSPHQKAKPPLLPPSGDCRDDDVSVLPSVPHAWGAQPIVIRLALQGLQPACTFKVSPESLVVKITSGADRIWSSQDCPRSVPTSDVVVRSGLPTYVNVTWSGKRSDVGCPGQLPWALKGFYHVYAAALGSTPTDVQFEITRAPTDRVTKTAKPRPSKSATPSTPAKPGKSARPSGKPTPSGTVTGKQTKCGGDNAADTC